MKCRDWVCPIVLSIAAGMLAGCGVQTGPVSEARSLRGIGGTVHGGQQPVAGATIQLYTVGTTGDGSAATPLISATVTTDANGAFNITGDYSCSAATQVYLVATGGNPGLSGNNPNLAMMTALGPCSGLTPTTFISVNEMTTVAAVAALAPYMNSLSAVGSGSSDAGSLQAAFTLAEELADSSSGTTPGLGVPQGFVVPVALMNTLADALSACVNSTGGAAGSSTNCGALFTATTPGGVSAPADTIQATLNLQKYYGLNPAPVYSLVQPASPFEPTLTATPPNYVVQLASNLLTVSPSTVTFSGTPVGGSSYPQTVAVSNTGSAAIALNLGLGGTNAADFPQLNNCPPTLVSGASCSVQVSFAPTLTSTESAYVIAGGQSVTLTGNAVAADTTAATLSASALNFFVANTPQVVTLTNPGTQPLAISSIVSSNPNFTEINNCGGSLSGQSVCEIEISATVVGVPNYSGTLTINSSDTGSPHVIALQAYSNYTQTQEQLFESGGEYVYSLSGGVYDGTVNYGGVILALYEYSANLVAESTVSGTGFGGGGTCFTHTGNSCSITFEIYPNYLAAAQTQYAYVTDINNVGYLLSGVSYLGGGDFTLSPPAMDFGKVATGSTAQANITLMNTYSSSAYLTINPPVLSQGALNNGEFSISEQNCTQQPVRPGSVYGGGTCVFTVSFTPKYPGLRQTTITVSDTNGYQRMVILQGTGSYAAPTISPTQVSFGNVALNAASSQMVTVTLPLSHPATAAITTNSGSTNAGEFSISGANTCSFGAASCQITVSFQPTTLGYAQALLSVTDTVSGITTSEGISGYGGQPVVSANPGSLTFTPRTVGTTSIAQTIILTNTGNQPLQVTAVTLGGSAPQDFNVTGGNSCSNLAVNGTCTLNVTNTPSTVGGNTAYIQIVSNASNSPTQIMLTETGS